ncbi:unnamed protein product, partial [Brassica rapa]
PQLLDGFCFDYNKSLNHTFLMGPIGIPSQPSSLTVNILTLFMTFVQVAQTKDSCTCKSFVLVFLELYNHIVSFSLLADEGT